MQFVSGANGYLAAIFDDRAAPLADTDGDITGAGHSIASAATYQRQASKQVCQSRQDPLRPQLRNERISPYGIRLP